MRPHPWPTPPDLAESPELAVLALLDATLDLAVSALLALYPELADPERPYWIDGPSAARNRAQTIATRAHALRDAIAAYRRTLAPAPDDLGGTIPDDIDF
jgi:hypothetical protein